MKYLATIAAMFLCLSNAFAGSTMSGVVRDNDGHAIENATVIIWTAGLREGYSTYCPSCYADCGKSAHTDRDGAFKIENLDGSLIFRVVVTAEGYRPAFVTKVDPSVAPVSATLDARAVPADAEKQSIKGRVVTADGTPLRFAVVSGDAVRFADGTNVGGNLHDFDPVAITNERGEFVLCGDKAFETIDLEVSARGYATAKFTELRPGAEAQELVVHEGGRIRGRVVRNGQPVPNVLVGAAQPERGLGVFFGEQTIGTDKDGRFTIESVPVASAKVRHGVDSKGNNVEFEEVSAKDAQLWNVYAKMASVKSLGASAIKSCAVDADGKTCDIGDIELKPGLSVSGRVVLADGAPMSPGMHVNAGIGGAWDTQTVEIASDGSFHFENLPPGECNIFASVKGYFLSRKNPSISWSLEGVLNHDVSNFAILMEPGEETFQGLCAGKNHGKPLQPIDQAAIDAVMRAAPTTRAAE